MKLTKFIRGSIVAMSCCGMLMGQMAQAAGTQTGSFTPSSATMHTAIRDVALQENGVLRGQVLDAQGAAQQAVPVVILREGQEIGRAQTDAQGQFAVQGLTGGVYQIATPSGAGMYRAWSPRTAPPAATQTAVIVPDNSVVRGQIRGGNALGWLANPWVLAAIVAAAIAIPLALDDDDAS